MSWDYAVLAHAAKEAGGPQKYIASIKDNAFIDGRTNGMVEGRIQGVGFTTAVLTVVFGAVLAICADRKSKESNKLLTAVKGKEVGLDTDDIDLACGNDVSDEESSGSE